MTLNLTQASILGDGWFIDVVADGGDVTIDPNSAETVNGLGTYVLSDGNSVQIRCDGARFLAILESGSEESAADLLTKLQTVDGDGSGLDADLLDGQEGSFYQNASNLNSGTVPSARLDLATQSEAEAGTDNTAVMTSLRTSQAIDERNPIFAAVAFNGDNGTIFNAQNVSSVTRNATGDYTILFSNAASNSNYAMAGMCISFNSNNTLGFVALHTASNGSATRKNTTGVRIETGQTNTTGNLDYNQVNVIIARTWNA